MPKKVSTKNWDTITVSTTPLMRERLSYIQRYLGMNSRSAAVALIVNEVYDRLVEKGYQTKLEKQLTKEIN